MNGQTTGSFKRVFKLDNMRGRDFTPKKITSTIFDSDYSPFLYKLQKLRFPASWHWSNQLTQKIRKYFEKGLEVEKLTLGYNCKT